MALITAVLALSLVWVPRSGLAAEGGKARTGGGRSPVLWTLAALVVHFTALSALWAFVDRLATRNGLSAEQIGSALGLSMFAGLLGALLVTWLADRYGRRMPLWLAATVFVAVGYGYHLEFSWSQFTALSGLLSLAWNFVLAYQMGIIADLDRVGRYAVLMPAAQSSGAMLGPILGGVLIAGLGYTELLLATGLGVVLATVVFSVFAGRGEAASYPA